MKRILMCAVALVAASPATGQAQDLAARIARAGDGVTRFEFATRPGVCGDGSGMIGTRRQGESTVSSTRISGRTAAGVMSDTDWNARCQPGPVRVALSVAGGRVREIVTEVGSAARVAGGTDLGSVAPGEAAAYLLRLAERGDPAAEKAIFPATLAADVEVWPELLRLARSERVGSESREQAVFWLGQQAGDHVTRHLTALVDADGPERGVRDAAIFALSRRPREEGVPALIRVARTHRDPQARRSALFWLGRTGDPRALALFEEILTRP